MLVAGAGMAGLVAAVRARELGADPVLLEKGDRAGGSMLLSSCVLWRHRSLEEFQRECPAGDPALQRVIVERLDEGIAWLESLGAEVVWQETGNERTVGKRFDPVSLTRTLLRSAGEIRLGERLTPRTLEALTEPLVLATGGFAARFARERGLLLRANPWSEGDGYEIARGLGAAAAGALGEFYGRNMPAPPARITESDYVPLAQLYGSYALVLNDAGEEFFAGPVSWSETDLVQATARQPGGRAWYLVGDEALERRVRERSVRELVEAARAAGGSVLEPSELSFAVPDWVRLGVHVAPGVTQTLGGLWIDEHARLRGESGAPLDGLLAAGADVGGISSGGYSSGLASALVFGRIAAETALS